MGDVCKVASEKKNTQGFWTDMSKVELFGHNAQNHMTVDDLGLF